MPYFSIKYTDGTMCDLTEIPRTTTVMYVCFQEGRHTLYSIKEVLTCEYEIVILTNLLCEHPSYKYVLLLYLPIPNQINISLGLKKLPRKICIAFQ